MEMIDILRSNDVVMEGLTEIMMHQEPSQRRGYIDAALEALDSARDNPAKLNKLFKDLQKIEGIDFDAIPDSKGDLTKYKYYHQMLDCMDMINSLGAELTTSNITTMNKLHNILLQARNDFTFGYKINNFIITSTYKTLVMSLHEILDICTIDLTDHLRAKISMNINKKTASRTREITKTINDFVRLYESGQWNTLMKHYRSGAKIASESYNSFEVAQEGEYHGEEIGPYRGPMTGALDLGKETVDTGKSIFNGIKNVGKGIGNFISGVWNNTAGKVAIILSALIALVMIIRKLVFYFYYAKAKLKAKLKRNSEILRANIDRGEDSKDAIEKQKKLLRKMEKTVDEIEYDLNKDERKASEEMVKADRANLNKQVISSNPSTVSTPDNSINRLSGSDFEFDF